MIRDIAFILAGYAAGSILFAKVFCSLLKKTDVAKNTKDNNPGTSNAFKNGGILCGALTLVCDVTKGFLPVFFYTRKEVTFLLALVVAAPVIGHVFSVFNGFRGGKGIATTFGCLFGLFPNLIPFAIFAGTFVFFSFILKINPHFHRTLVTYFFTELQIVIFAGNLIVCAGFSFILAAVFIRFLTSKEKKPPLEVKPIWIR